jgi:hypothetical protein
MTKQEKYFSNLTDRLQNSGFTNRGYSALIKPLNLQIVYHVFQPVAC